MRVLDDWLLTSDRIAVHEPTMTAVIADPHFGYGEARRQAGDAVPIVSVAAELDRLASALQRVHVSRLLIAGDVVEVRWSEGLVDELLAWTKSTSIELIGITPGNHDRGVAMADDRFVLRPDGIVLGDWRVCHGDRTVDSDKIVHGHIHPCVVRGGRRRPCYLVGKHRLVLPAFSRDAAGVNVAGDPRWRGCQALLCEAI